MSSELYYPHHALSVRILQSFPCEGRLPLPMCSAVPTPVTACGRELLICQQQELVAAVPGHIQKAFSSKRTLPNGKGSATLFICPNLEGENVPTHKHLAGRDLQQGS